MVNLNHSRSDVEVSYDYIGAFYDEVIGNRDNDKLSLKTLVHRYCKSSQSILELGCGTAELLTPFIDTHKITGLDLSSEMISIASRKIPTGTFIQGDMTKFSMDDKFDLIVCLFSSISQCGPLDYWKMVFQTAYRHLNSDGIFIFSANTPYKHDQYSKLGAVLTKSDNSYYIRKIVQTDENVVSCEIEILSRVNDNIYKLHKTDIDHWSYDSKDIIKALSVIFRKVECFDENDEHVGEHSMMINYVCSR